MSNSPSYWNLAQHLAKRPDLCTPNGSIFELISFFEGYSYGTRQLSAFGKVIVERPVNFCESVDKTLDWVLEKSGLLENEPNRNSLSKNVIDQFVAQFPTETEAMDAMFEFASSINENQSE